MAENPTGFTAPKVGIGTELYYATDASGTGLKQVFGVQTIPVLTAPKEDVTYTRLESWEEGATKGRSPFESLETQLIHYPEQYLAMKTVANTDTDVFWFVKYPGASEKVDTWSGSMDITRSEVNDGVEMDTLKMGKTTNVTQIDTIPTPTP